MSCLLQKSELIIIFVQTLSSVNDSTLLILKLVTFQFNCKFHHVYYNMTDKIKYSYSEKISHRNKG